MAALSQTLNSSIVRAKLLFCNEYITQLIGVISRTFYDQTAFDEATETKRQKCLRAIYTDHHHYFTAKPDRWDGTETWALEADTIVGVKRLINIANTIYQTREIDGDFVETGVWKGGCCILANAVIQELKLEKRVHVCDSFMGASMACADYPIDGGNLLHTIGFLTVPLETVKCNFTKYDLLTPNVVFRPGWFAETMKDVDDIKSISVLRLDADMYGATIIPLRTLYPKVSKCGFIIVDDWSDPAAKAAITDYQRVNGTPMTIRVVDKSSMCWQKVETAKP